MDDGRYRHLTLAYTAEYVRRNGIQPGRYLLLDLPEIGFRGRAFICMVQTTEFPADGEGDLLVAMDRCHEGDSGVMIYGKGSAAREILDRRRERTRELVLVMDKPDGTRVDITLLRAVEWIEAHAGEIGGNIFLDLPHMGARGYARVVAINPCPPFDLEGLDDPGSRMVTGTFRHSAGDVYDLKLQSEDGPIGVTGTHPFWSVDRNAWISVIDLQIGETLRTLDGTTHVQSLTSRPEPEAVYNIEVEGDHVYRVGQSGVLVHNASVPCCRVDDGPGTPGPYANLEHTDQPDIPIAASSRFVAKQKAKILKENAQNNSGQLKSDDPDDPAPLLAQPQSVSPTEFPKPPKPRDENNCLNEAQIDHIKPFASGGSNSYCNARVISQELNIRKQTGRPASDPCK